jgi:NAD(P)-dependent dehydrogenase (short-subunit alcohol dehydrogenase family)
MSEGSLSGQVALITGGSRGIGLAIARRLLESGASIAVLARDSIALGKVVDTLSTIGGAVIPIIADVTDSRSMELAVQRTVDAPGRFEHPG